MTDPNRPIQSLERWALTIHDNAHQHGFWPPEGRNFGEQIALIHSELSEALEEHRSNRPDVYVPYHSDMCPATPPEDVNGTGAPGVACFNPACKPEGAAVELVDVIIRALDTLATLNIPGGSTVDDLINWKHLYNVRRPHKHGRSY